MMSAATEYKARRIEAEEQMKRIEELLAAHSAKQEQHPTHYTYTGDMGHVCEMLTDIIEFLS